VLSGLTNIWLVLSAALLLRRRSGPRRLLLAGLAVAAAINAMWLVLFEGFSDLRIGYYFWTVSFVLMAAASRRDRLQPALTAASPHGA
jgi:hypothetical protein